MVDETAPPVQIPAELAAEVARHPERFRPPVDLGQSVLILWQDDDTGVQPHVGMVGTVNGGNETRVSLGIVTRGGGLIRTRAAAWALVGSVDGGARAAEGDRVLVLGSLPGVAVVGEVGTVLDADPPYEPLIVARTDGSGYYHAPVTWWALLPPAPEVAQ